MKVLALALLATTGYVSAQKDASAEAFTDPATGISFQAYTSSRGAKFGVALPKTGSKDLIGVLVRGFTRMPCQFATWHGLLRKAITRQQYIKNTANHWLVCPKRLYLCRWSFGPNNE
jgi:hypothetical protein